MKKILSFLSVLMISFILTFLLNNTPKVQATEVNKQKESEFRAVWVSYYTGDINYKNEYDYKNQIDTILDNMEHYNMNAIIFHIRANHDAWYNSSINKVNSQLSKVNFEVFDPLKYVIDESHKRGIEFHAWLNPYRIGSKYNSASEIANEFINYPDNPASNEENVLIGNPLQILDPANPNVREFIIDTCMEIVENYDVDAIHFDDYFYAAGIDDSDSFAKYNTSNLSLSDFRRKQVDTFIFDLKTQLDTYNKKNNKFVQLGISPTGVYKNANSVSEANTPLSEYKYNENGDLIYPIGATMGCQMHYESYLYCDTLKWVNNEWINYILPQTYWPTTHSLAPYEPLINWWNMAVKNKNVNLYTGMGIYMWKDQSKEALRQLNISSNLDNVMGTSIYSYQQIKTSVVNPTSREAAQMNDILNNVWNNLAILPKISGFEEEEIGSVNNFFILKDKLIWDNLPEAKFYIIYGSNKELEYTDDEIVDIIGSKDSIVTWNIIDNEIDNYDVVPLSYTNNLGKPTTKLEIVEEKKSTVNMKVSLVDDKNLAFETKKAYNIELGKNLYTFIDDENIVASLDDFDWVSSNPEVAIINEIGKVETLKIGTTEIIGILKSDNSKVGRFYVNVYQGQMIEQYFNVKFVDLDGVVIKEEQVKFGESANGPINVDKESTTKYEYTFKGWNDIFSNITENKTIIAIYDKVIRKYNVKYVNKDGSIFATREVAYGETAPILDEKPTIPNTVEHRYRFNRWDGIEQIITEDTILNAIYDTYDQYYILKFDTNGGSSVTTKGYYYYDSINSLPIPTKDNLKFGGWYYDEELTQKCNIPFSLTENTTLFAKWLDKITISYYDDNGKLINTIDEYEECLVTPIEAPDKEGYLFIGWKLDGTSELFDFNNPILKSIDLYPIYEKIDEEVKVIFYNKDKTINKVVSVKKGNTVESIGEIKKEGYTFIGWVLKNSDVIFNFDIPITETIELYPLYMKNKTTFKVIFYNEDGSIYKEFEALENSLLKIPDVIEKDGYLFVCWQKKGTNIKIDENYVVNNDLELVPIYEKVNTPPKEDNPKNCKCNNTKNIELVITFLSLFTLIVIYKRRKY